MLVGSGTEDAISSLGSFERPLPNRVMSSPGAMPAVKGAELAALTTPCGLRNTPDPLTAGAGRATFKPRNVPIPDPTRMPFAPTTYRIAEVLYVPLEVT